MVSKAIIRTKSGAERVIDIPENERTREMTPDEMAQWFSDVTMAHHRFVHFGATVVFFDGIETIEFA